jgi:hypothetical protein
MLGRGMKLLLVVAACALIFFTVVAVATIRETAVTIREGLPEFAQTYLLIDGLPDSPAETVVEYRQGLDEIDGRNNRGLVWLIVALVFVVLFFMTNMLIGPEGLKGLFHQMRLTLLAWNRRGRSTGEPQRRRPGDDEWVDFVNQMPSARQLPAPNNPWLLPAQAQSQQLDDNG